MYRLACLSFCLAGTLLAQGAQPPETSLPLVNQLDQRTINDLVNAIRTCADVRDASYDASARTFNLRANSSQLALVQWVLRLVDVPAGTPGPGGPVSYTYTGASGNDAENTAVRMFFLSKADPPAEIQDFQNIFRTGADIQRVFPINSMNALLVRATPERVATAEWAVQQLDHATAPGATASYVFGLSAAEQTNPRINRTTALRVFFFANIATPHSMQDIQNVMRTGADIQRVCPFNSKNALMIRGEPERVALAEWLVKQLDQKPRSARPPVSYDYVDPFYPTVSRTVRVFFVDHFEITSAAGQALLSQIRTQAGIQRVFPMSTVNAVIVGGTVDQVAAAEKLVTDADNAAGGSQ